MANSPNAIQFFHDVRVASQKELPNFHDFFNYSIQSGNQQLVKAISSMPESCFSSAEECVKHLNEEFFSKSKSSTKWVDMVESRKRGRREVSASKSPKKQKVKAKNRQTAPQL